MRMSIENRPEQKRNHDHQRSGHKTDIALIYHRIRDLKLDPKNPRTHSPKQIRDIAHSIEVFGFNVPVLIDANLKVVAGHGRIAACQLLGLTEVPTISVDHLNEAQAQAFKIADNRLTETSAWDERLLAEQLKELSELHLDFSLEVTGFEMGEIDLRIEGLKSVPEAAEDPADRLPLVGAQITQTGDQWLLREHQVRCANALDADEYTFLFGKSRAAMVITDPPFNVRIEGNVSGLGGIRHRDFIMASGEMDPFEFTAFLSRTFKLLARYSSDGSIHFICMDWRHMGELLSAGHEAYGELKNVCVWVKNNGGMGSFYRSRHELIFVFKHGNAAHRNNVQLGQFGRNRTNVWDYPCISSFGKSGEEGNLLAIHPTVKPVALVADAIMDASARGEIILDSFLGSGTTVIAAERTGRRCYGLELDPTYVDASVRRWQAYTGERARHAVSGRFFDELEAEAQEHHDR
jgi:DNA modification methylase/ParB-like chromosome segregation protein Spo0J